MTPATDQLLGDRYRLTELIARGGMGEVWRAADELLNRWVAVKVLRPELAGDPGFLGRFRAEARTTALISHPGIAALHDYGEQDGQAYLVMELVPGEPLSALIGRSGAAGLDVDLALRYVGQAAMALQAAHEAGVVHRDIKPANLLITPGGQVKITDFGIAKAIGDGAMTGTGIVMGTAHYLSPEQASGKEATPASDVYALGIVLHECLTGSRPFPGENPVKIAMAQVNEKPPALPDTVPGRVRGLVARMLAKDPVHRPTSAGTLAREVASLRAGLRSDGDDGDDFPPPTGRRRRVSEVHTQLIDPAELPDGNGTGKLSPVELHRAANAAAAAAGADALGGLPTAPMTHPLGSAAALPVQPGAAGATPGADQPRASRGQHAAPPATPEAEPAAVNPPHVPGQGRRRRVVAEPDDGHGQVAAQVPGPEQASGLDPGQGYSAGQTYGPGASQAAGRRRSLPRGLPFGLDGAVPAERRTLFLLVWVFIALLAILIGYALASGDGQDSAIGMHRSNNSAAGFVHSFATAHTMVGS